MMKDAKKNQEDNYETYLTKAGLTVEQINSLKDLHYFSAPASKGHHLTKFGGLAEHCENVTRRLLEMTRTLGVEWPRPESPYIVGMLHDLVKCRCYGYAGDDDEGRPTWEYVQPTYPGHGSCSVAIAAEIGIRLRPAEIAAITYHMGLYGCESEYSKKEFSAAMAMYAPQILATIYADWWAARVDEEKRGEHEQA